MCKTIFFLNISVFFFDFWVCCMELFYIFAPRMIIKKCKVEKKYLKYTENI